MMRPSTVSRRTVVASLATTAALAIAGCDGGDDDPPADTTALTAQVPGGEQLCEFVPSESVALALGTDEFDANDGFVSRDANNALSGAACGASVDDDELLSIKVDFMLGYAGSGFRDRLSDDDDDRLPDDAGLGFSWTEEPDGDDEPAVGEARLSHGDYIIEVRVVGVAEGRDPAADAVALAQQTIRTLEIPDEWTLPGSPPSGEQ